MPIDTSMYQTIQAPQVQYPQPAQLAETSLRLSDLALQNQSLQMQRIAQQRKIAQTQGIQQAYMDNTDPTSGQVDRQGFLSTLGKNPYTASLATTYATNFAAQDKAQADAKSAQLDVANKTLNITGRAFDYLHDLTEDQRSQAYPGVIQQLKDQGVDTSRMDHPYDPQLFQQYYGTWQKSKPALENALTQANINKTQADVGLLPLQKQNEQFGTRSANAELSQQYNKDVAPIKSSQIAMRQMMDNYNNPSPQGDASLKLNAFKIKFPTAPDVNSLDELSNAQGITDKMKAWLTHNVQGTLDPETRANLMRDAVSTYRANYGTYQTTAQKYQGMAAKRGVNLGGMTDEPELTSTYQDAMALQKNIGPYVPTTQRGGVVKAIMGPSSSSSVPSESASSSEPPSGSIKMSDGTRTKWIPASLKGRAITEGWDVVK